MLLFAQTVDLARTETAYFTIDLPPTWKIDAVTPEDEQSKEREYDVINADAKKVFTVTVAIDAPRFIECFCVPWRAYKRYKKDGLKYAEVRLTKLDVRTVKVVGHKYGTDVHLRYAGSDRPTLDRVVDSIRPK